MNPETAASHARWHRYQQPQLSALRAALEARLGGACSFCGLTRDDGVNLQFHHHLGRDYAPRLLSWWQRLRRYETEISAGTLKYLACDQTGNNCHEKCRRGEEPGRPTKLYDYEHDNEARRPNQPF